MFSCLNSEKEIKDQYKKLAKQYHPDLGGCTEKMKQLNEEYEKSLTALYQSCGKSITEIDTLLKSDSVLRESLMKILAIENLIVEVCGEWIWITGETQKAKGILKSAGFLWASKKKAWFWRTPGKRSFNRREWGLDEIRSKHGSSVVRSKKSMALT